MSRKLISLLLFSTILALLVACGSDEAAAPAAEESRPASLAGFEAGAVPSGELPPGHPPIPDSPMPPIPQGAGSGPMGLTWTAPEGWEQQPPSSAMRQAQYRVPGEAGDAELVVFYFGPGQGGDARSNAERWAQQFNQPDGSSPLSALKTEEVDINGLKTMLVETTGVYQNTMAPMAGGGAPPAEGYMLLAAIVQGPDSNWFFKLTGPQATVEGQRAGFEQLTGSLQTGG